MSGPAWVSQCAKALSGAAIGGTVPVATEVVAAVLLETKLGPPVDVEAVADAQIAAQLVDGLLLIVKWGRTPQDQVLEWLNSGGIDERNILGVILNQVDLKMLPSYPVDTGTFGVRRRATVA